MWSAWLPVPFVSINNVYDYLFIYFVFILFLFCDSVMCLIFVVFWFYLDCIDIDVYYFAFNKNLKKKVLQPSGLDNSEMVYCR